MTIQIALWTQHAASRKSGMRAYEIEADENWDSGDVDVFIGSDEELVAQARDLYAAYYRSGHPRDGGYAVRRSRALLQAADNLPEVEILQILTQGIEGLPVEDSGAARLIKISEDLVDWTNLWPKARWINGRWEYTGAIIEWDSADGEHMHGSDAGLFLASEADIRAARAAGDPIALAENMGRDEDD